MSNSYPARNLDEGTCGGNVVGFGITRAGLHQTLGFYDPEEHTCIATWLLDLTLTRERLKYLRLYLSRDQLINLRNDVNRAIEIRLTVLVQRRSGC